jgi:hypothetical protein
MQDEYRELLENARAALCDLLMASEPGTHLLPLQKAYDILKQAADRPTLSSTTAQRPLAHDSDAHSYRERRAAWRRLPIPARGRLIVELLGEDVLTCREIARRVDAQYGADYNVYTSTVQAELYRLMQAGEVRRRPGYGGRQNPHRYFRNRDLEGPIADLERTYRDAADGGTA